jgi:hypothetical protein
MLICISITEMEAALLQLQWQVPLRPPSVSGFQTASKRSAVTVLPWQDTKLHVYTHAAARP